MVYGLIPFKIERKNIALGAITIPVIPLSIVYAPPVDAQKLNQASSSESKTIGNSTMISFSKEKSETVPLKQTLKIQRELRNG